MVRVRGAAAPRVVLRCGQVRPSPLAERFADPGRGRKSKRLRKGRPAGRTILTRLHLLRYCRPLLLVLQ